MPNDVQINERDRPETFIVYYHGQPIVFRRLTEEHGDAPASGRVIGYSYRCPFERDKKKGTSWIDTESGKFHSIEFDDHGRATIKGSLLHRPDRTVGCNCGWHVMITNGIAEDV